MTNGIEPVAKTGGRGYDFEDHVAVFFLMQMIAGNAYWGTEFGPITSINWQNRADGWLLDDLCLVLTDTTGENHNAAMSIKSNQQIKSTGFPKDFNSNIWQQWVSEEGPFKKNRDIFVFSIGNISDSVYRDWSDISSEIRETDSARIAKRIAANGAWSKSKKQLFISLTSPIDTHSSLPSEIAELIKHIRILPFDFQNDPSDSFIALQAHARNLCTSHSQQDGELLLNKLFELSRVKRGSGGTCRLDDIYCLSNLPSMVTHPQFHQDIEKIIAFSNEEIGSIQDTIAGGFSFQREKIFEKIRTELSSSQAVILLGESGIGKSALAKKFFLNSDFEYKFWFSSRFWNRNNLDNPMQIVLENIPSSSVLIVFDAIDRLESTEKLKLIKIIELSKERGYSVVITAIENSLINDTLIVEIPPLDEDDLKSLFEAFPNIKNIWKSKGMRSLIRIPKVLDWLVELDQKCGQIALSINSFSEHIWNRWIQSDNPERKYCRAQQIKQIAELDAEKIKPGVPVSKVSDLSAIGELESDNILVIRDELIFWKHDLIGDWAREHILIEHLDDFLSFIADKFTKTHWKHSILFFGQWLLEDDHRRSYWIRYISEAKGELQGLLWDSIIFSSNAYEFCLHLKDVLIANNCILLNQLLDRLFLVSVLYEKGQNDESSFPLPNLRLRTPFLEFLFKEQEVVIPHCHYRISELCIWFNIILPAGYSIGRLAARLSVDTALFLYNNEKSRKQEKDWRNHLYLKDDQINTIWYAFLHAYKEYPDEVIHHALIFAERVDMPTEANIDENPDEQEDCDERYLLLRGEYIPAWPLGPKRNICDRFREACLQGNLLIPIFSQKPNVASEILKAVCIEAPHYDGFGSSHLLDQCGLYHFHENLNACGYFMGPWLQLLKENLLAGLETIIELINFATERFVEAARKREAQDERVPQTGLLKLLKDKDFLEISMIHRSEEDRLIWIGNSQVFGWYRNYYIDSEIVPSMLMALEKWFYDQVESQNDIDEALDYIINNNKSVAIAGILCALAKKHPELLDGKLGFILSAWQFFIWDHKIQMDEHCWEFGFDMTYGRLGQDKYNEALKWNQLPHRKQVYQDICITHFIKSLICNSSIKWYKKVVTFWEMQNSTDDSLPFFIAKFTQKNYSLVKGPKGIEVRFQLPEQLKQESVRDQEKCNFSLAKMNYPFRCRKIIDDELTLTQDQTDELWNEMQRIASTIEKSKKGKEQMLEESMSDELCGSSLIYCAGIAATLSGNSQYIINSLDKLKWTLDKLFQIRNNSPKKNCFDMPRSVGLFWDVFWGEAAIMLYVHCQNRQSLRDLLASCILAFHYSAIEKALLCARKLLTNENNLISLINLHILYSMSRGLSDYESYDSGLRVLANKKFLEHYDAFIASSIEDKNIIDILKLHRKYLSLRDKQLGFSIPLMQLSKNPFIYICGIVLKNVMNCFHLPKKTSTKREPWIDNIRKAPLSDFKKIYLQRFSRHCIVDLNQMMLHLELINFDQTQNFSYDNQVSLLCETEKLMLWQLRFIPDFELIDRHDSLSYPRDESSKCLAKIATSLIKLKDKDASELWEPIFNLPEYFHNWIKVFISFWFCSDLKKQEDVDKFASLWQKMLVFVTNAPIWQKRSYDINELWMELLGMNVHKSFWSDERLIPVIEQIKPFYLSWAQEHLKNYNAIDKFVNFCLSDVGHILVREGIIIIYNVLSNDDPRFSDSTPILLSKLCSKTWNSYGSSLDNDKEFESAFFAILSTAASKNCHSAQELYSTIEQQRENLIQK